MSQSDASLPATLQQSNSTPNSKSYPLPYFYFSHLSSIACRPQDSNPNCRRAGESSCQQAIEAKRRGRNQPRRRNAEYMKLRFAAEHKNEIGRPARFAHAWRAAVGALAAAEHAETQENGQSAHAAGGSIGPSALDREIVAIRSCVRNRQISRGLRCVPRQWQCREIAGPRVHRTPLGAGWDWPRSLAEAACWRLLC